MTKPAQVQVPNAPDDDALDVANDRLALQAKHPRPTIRRVGPHAEGSRPWGRISRKSWLRVALWGVPTAALFFIPLVFWTGPAGDRMNLGGDDSHFMFEYPWQWLVHASMPLDQNLMGYNPRAFFVPFTALMVGIKATGLNVEGIAFGCVLALTFIGIARLTLELLGNFGLRAEAAALVAGLLVVCAPLVSETQWTSLLTAVLWEPLLPWLFLLYIWHQRRGSRRVLLAMAVVVALAAPAMNEFAWTISCGILLLGLAAIAAALGRYQLRPKRLALMLVTVAAINAFWIVPVTVAAFMHQSQFVSALSEGGKADALFLVRFLAPLMNPADALALRNSAGLLAAAHSNTLPIDEWSRSLPVLGALPVAIVLGGFVSSLTNRRHWAVARSIALLAFATLVFLYFETVNVTSYGIRLFEFLTQSVPGWTAERNFYDKFAIPFIEIFAITFGLCLYQLIRELRAAIAIAVCVGVAVGLAVYDAPFLAGAEFRLPYFVDRSYSRVMPDGLPSTYTDMLERIRKLPPGAVLTLPLSKPAWSVVADTRADAAYIGISPIFFLTGRSDYNGVDSFSTPLSPYLASIVANDLDHGYMAQFARLVGQLGVRYVLVATNDDISREFYRVSAVADPQLERYETETLVNEYAKEVIARSGPYELRAFSPSYSKPMVSIEQPSNVSSSSAYLEAVNIGVDAGPDQNWCGSYKDVQIRPVSPDHYVLRLPPGQPTCALVFRAAYSPGWQAKVTFLSGRHEQTVLSSRMAYGFANSFVLDASAEWRQVDLVFWPRDIVPAASAISVLALFGLVLATSWRTVSVRRLRRVVRGIARRRQLGERG